MRRIGTIEDRRKAEQFAAYLVTQGIACSVDGADSSQVIWVQEEDRVSDAKEELSRFQNEPDHERYRAATRLAATVTRQQEKLATATRKRTVDLRDRWNRPAVERGPATLAFIGLMLVVGVMTGLAPGKHPEFTSRMLFSTDGTMNAIWSGEVWRLVTPIFLHFGIMHFLFNLIALRDLGLLMEFQLGTPKFFGMVLVIAVLSNAAQFGMTGGSFGGMSGVNYGLFGYIWVRSRLDPESGFWIHPTSVTYMLGWYLLCLAGVIPNIANWAHTGGLIAGAVMGASRPMWKSLVGR